MTDKYPFDFDLLKKGDTIQPETLTKVLNRRIGTKEYAFGVMGLQKQIMREMAARGRPVTVCQIKDALHVCTDAEASQYNEKQAKVGRRKIGRAWVRIRYVDTSKLTAEELAEHDKRMMFLGRLNHGVTRKKIAAPEPYKSILGDAGFHNRITSQPPDAM